MAIIKPVNKQYVKNLATVAASQNLWDGAISGSHTVTSAEASASACYLLTGLDTIHGEIVQAVRSGSAQAGMKWSTSGCNIVISSSTYVLTANDVINFVAF